MKAKKEKESISVGLRLSSIQETRFFINQEFDYSKLLVQENDVPIEISMAYNLSYDLDKEYLFFNQKTDYLDKNSKEKLMEIELKFTFFVKGLKDIIDINEDNSFSFKVDLFPNIYNVAVGTLRGVIFAKTALHPLFSKFPFPLVNMQGEPDPNKK